MEDKIELKIELTEKEMKLIHTWIRRSIWEDYLARIAECGWTDEQIRNETEQCIMAFAEIRHAIEEKWGY